jgi:hypothetical protein
MDTVEFARAIRDLALRAHGLISDGAPGLGRRSHCAFYHVPCPGLLLECRTRIGVVGRMALV